MLKIWGRMSSIDVCKVVWAAQEVAVAFERADAGGPFGVVETSEFKHMNPNALVPVIDDHGYRLWESNVIVRYLCAKHSSGQLYPTDLHARFDAERWMDWQQTALNPATQDAYLQLVRTSEEQRSVELIEDSVARTERLMQLLDDHLSRQAFLAADHFTMADIPVACEVHRWRELPHSRPPRAHLERWYKAISAREAVAGVLDLPIS
jgi:glutathione S-transferase